MARPRSATIYEAGAVRVTGRPGRYRLRWVEAGVERESTRKTEPEAIRAADAINGRLQVAGEGLVSGATAYGALADAWVEYKAPDWSSGHLANIQAILDGHVLPVVGRLSCDRVTDVQLAGILRSMAADGYSTEWCGQACRIMRAIGRWGVRKGVWTVLGNPAAELKAPVPNRLIDRALIPSAALIVQLRATVREQAPNPDQQLRREWMIAAAAGCGLRFSEAGALTAAQVDLARREVAVVQAWNRELTGPPVLGPPKSRHSVRTGVIPEDDVALWREIVQATDGGAFLGTTQRGRTWRSSGWKQRVWDRAVEEVDGWPDRASYHSLRHAAIVAWLEKGVRIGNAARLAGHHSARFTHERYIGPDTDYLDQARDLL